MVDQDYGGLFAGSRFVSQQLLQITRRELMAVFHAYFDYSGSEGDCPYVVYAGAMATDKAWLEISEKWVETLSKKNISSLHMTEIMGPAWRSQRQNERDELLVTLSDLVADSVERIFVGVHSTAQWMKLSQAQRAKFRNIQNAMFEACVKTLFEVSELRANDTVHLYFDSSGDAAEHLKTYLAVRQQSALIRGKCAMIAFGEDELMPPLQLADMIAYCYFQGALKPTKSPQPIIELILRTVKQRNRGRSGNLVYNMRGRIAKLGSGQIEVEDDEG
jgi:hypothetical protein